MTIPDNINLPIFSGSTQKDLEKYIIDLVKRLEESYRVESEAINGLFRTSTGTTYSQWLPTIVGSSTDGTATYSRQYGLSVRKALITNVFFDLEWSLHTGTGDLQVLLPYTIADSLGGTAIQANIFIGSAASGNLVPLGAEVTCVLEGVSGQPRSNLVAYTLNSSRSNIQINASGRLQGNLCYVGKRDS